MRVFKDFGSMRSAGKLTPALFIILLGVLRAGCAAVDAAFNPRPDANDCPLTEPVWLLPPEDAASNDPPGYGYYFVNEDQSILASAWYVKYKEPLRVNEDGIKVGWFRPEGAPLEITGRRIDGQADPLVAEIPCCYPTRFQATGLYFPSEGCWEVNAKAAESSISFVVFVEP